MQQMRLWGTSSTHRLRRATKGHSYGDETHVYTVATHHEYHHHRERTYAAGAEAAAEASFNNNKKEHTK